MCLQLVYLQEKMVVADQCLCWCGETFIGHCDDVKRGWCSRISRSINLTLKGITVLLKYTALIFLIFPKYYEVYDTNFWKWACALVPLCSDIKSIFLPLSLLKPGLYVPFFCGNRAERWIKPKLTFLQATLPQFVAQNVSFWRCTTECLFLFFSFIFHLCQKLQ